LALGACLGFLLVWWPAPARAQNTLHWVTNYYAVNGATFPEIMDSIGRSRPARLKPPLSGLTEWNIRWHFFTVPSDHGYRCSSFTTQTTLTNTLPFWRAPTNAAYHVRTAWMRYSGNLAIHEGGHSRIALAALAEIHKQVKTIPEAPDFESMRNLVNSTVERVLDRYRRMESEYDRLTEHGAKQFATGPRDLPGP
jgi:predicted secreted Zn-dependent protease